MQKYDYRKETVVERIPSHDSDIVEQLVCLNCGTLSECINASHECVDYKNVNEVLEHLNNSESLLISRSVPLSPAPMHISNKCPHLLRNKRHVSSDDIYIHDIRDGFNHDMKPIPSDVTKGNRAQSVSLYYTYDKKVLVLKNPQVLNDDCIDIDSDVISQINTDYSGTNIGNSNDSNVQIMQHKVDNDIIGVINETMDKYQNGIGENDTVVEDIVFEGIDYGIDQCGAKEVNVWLTSIGLSEYYKLFVKNGFDSMEIVLEINDKSDLFDIGIALKAHQLKLMNHINKLKPWYCRPVMTVI